MGSCREVLPGPIAEVLDGLAAGCGLKTDSSGAWPAEFFPEREWSRLMARAGEVPAPMAHFRLPARSDAVYLPEQAFASGRERATRTEPGSGLPIWEVAGTDYRFVLGRAQVLAHELGHLAAVRAGFLDPTLRALIVRAGSAPDASEPLWVIHASSLLRPPAPDDGD